MKHVSSTEYNKIEKQVKALHSFLMTLCVKCSSGFTYFPVSNILRTPGSGLPKSIMGTLEDLGYIKSTGIATGKKYHWIAATPTEDQAEEINAKSRENLNEYKKNKVDEKKGFKETIRTGAKSFIRILPKEKAVTAEPRKYSTTPTEIHVEGNLHKLKSGLQGREVLDLNSFFDAKVLPMPFQYAVITLGLITKEKGRGYKFKDEINYELVRKVIDARKDYIVEVSKMPVIVETQPTPSAVQVTVAATPSVPKVVTKNEDVVSLDEEEVDMKELAAMFAEVGNFSMAQKLLKEVLKK